jgi:hypothetical protein
VDIERITEQLLLAGTVEREGLLMQGLYDVFDWIVVEYCMQEEDERMELGRSERYLYLLSPGSDGGCPRSSSETEGGKEAG